MKHLTLAGMLLLAAMSTKADLITDVETTLTTDASLPLANGMADTLASNLLTAQADSSYAASEPDSLALSIDAVLRAISLEGTLFGETEITQGSFLAIAQSEIAIDDRAAVGITVNGIPCDEGCIINFGNVPVETPEVNTWIMVLSGIVIVLIGIRRRSERT